MKLTGKTHVILVEENLIFREGLRLALEQDQCVADVAMGADGRSALALISQFQTGILIISDHLPDLPCQEIVKDVRMKNDKVKIIVVANDLDVNVAAQMLKLGVQGYILKSSLADELLLAVKYVFEGNHYISSDLTRLILQNIMNPSMNPYGKSSNVLTPREQTVLKMISQGHSSKSISEQLVIQTRTVGVYRRKIYRKLQVHNVAELTLFALKHGIK